MKKIICLTVCWCFCGHASFIPDGEHLNDGAVIQSADLQENFSDDETGRDENQPLEVVERNSQCAKYLETLEQNPKCSSCPLFFPQASTPIDDSLLGDSLSDDSLSDESPFQESPFTEEVRRKSSPSLVQKLSRDTIFQIFAPGSERKRTRSASCSCASSFTKLSSTLQHSLPSSPRPPRRSTSLSQRVLILSNSKTISIVIPELEESLELSDDLELTASPVNHARNEEVKRNEEAKRQEEVKRRRTMVNNFVKNSCKLLMAADVQNILNNYNSGEEFVNNNKCSQVIYKFSVCGVTTTLTSLSAGLVQLVADKGVNAVSLATLIASPIILMVTGVGFLCTFKSVRKSEQEKALFDHLKGINFPKQPGSTIAYPFAEDVVATNNV